jgi:maleylacetate reductase
VPRDFTWIDSERLVRFGERALEEAPELLRSRGFEGFTLLTTERHAGRLSAAEVVYVPPGRVDEISAGLLPGVPARPLVGFGGGRVIDTAKALGAALEQPVAAVPTTLSGAEMTPFHRVPPGVSRLVRPSLVIAVPSLMASLPPANLAASAMNALAHAVEALYVPLANPVSDLAARRAIELLGGDELPLGALLAGYASGSAGYAVHHVLGQTIVRTTGAPHAQTYAGLLPHTALFLAARAPHGAESAIARLSARAGVHGLGELGVERSHIEPVLDAALRRPELGNTPRPPERDELRELLEAAL